MESSYDNKCVLGLNIYYILLYRWDIGMIEKGLDSEC